MMSDPFDDVKKMLAALKKEQERLERVKRCKTDWDNPGSRKEYVRMYKQTRRRARLDKAVPDRRCPLCKVIYPKPKSWVLRPYADFTGHDVPKLKEVAVCRSCWMKRCSK